MQTIGNHSNILYTRQNDKQNYLLTLLSSDEFTDAPIDTHHMVVLPKPIYQYYKTTLHNDDLVQLDLAQRLLKDLPNYDTKHTEPVLLQSQKQTQLLQQQRL